MMMIQITCIIKSPYSVTLVVLYSASIVEYLFIQCIQAYIKAITLIVFTIRKCNMARTTETLFDHKKP